MKAQKVLDYKTSLINQMSKQIKKQQHKYAIKVAYELPSMDDPYCTIFESVKLKTKIKDCKKTLKRSYSEDEDKLLTAYCTAQILYRNSQRSGVIENVKINEYLEMNVNHEGNPVIQCLDHKTSLEGPAQLVLNKLTNQLLDKYYKLVC